MANNSTASSLNGSSSTLTTFQPLEQEEWKEVFNMFIVIAEIIITLTALVSNCLVVYAFTAYKKLRASVTNYFVISLAISDILTSGLVTTLKLDSTLKGGFWTHGSFMCSLYTTMYLLAVPSSVINLCAVTVDRYLVLRMPLRYNSLMPPRRAVFIISCLWIYALAWACLPVMGWKSSNLPVVANGYCYFISTRKYNITVNIINFLLPMIFMAISWLFIYSIVQQHRKRVLKIERSLSLNTNDSSNSSNQTNMNGEALHQMNHLAQKNNKTDRKTMRRNVRGSRYIGFIVVLFYFCWLPYVTLSMIGNLCKSCKIPYIMYDAFLALGFLNSALNPFLYPFHDKHFKEAFRNMWKKMRSKTFVKLMQWRKMDAV
ncbi:hypothetical protein OS493_002785 [Desmophyllum pertusum]|uniref:G-protein coupled receptors family 1 profile domain-containing protein n=1 Tax=Desmophyllum pertusum TaxID=174260 RepID=A0A9W9YFX0_9CNID|nr:hypothetical protein OS493_002785 [Desmophyllum pertusum]